MTAPTLWASNVNYDTGPSVGLPCKSDPSSDTNGLIPGQLVAPQHLNFVLNQHSASMIDAERFARRGLVIEEDFVGAVVDGSNLITGSGTWVLSGTGSPSMVYANSSAGSPGLVRITTSATNGHSAILTFASPASSNFNVEDVAEIEFRFRRVTASSNWGWYAGLTSTAAPGFGSVSRHVEYDPTTSALTRSLSQQGGADAQALGTGGVTTFQSFRITNPGVSGTESEQYGATSHVATTVAHAANIVTSGTGLQVAISIETVSALAVTLEIDYVKIRTVELARGGYG